MRVRRLAAKRGPAWLGLLKTLILSSHPCGSIRSTMTPTAVLRLSSFNPICPMLRRQSEQSQLIVKENLQEDLLLPMSR